MSCTTSEPPSMRGNAGYIALSRAFSERTARSALGVDGLDLALDAVLGDEGCHKELRKAVQRRLQVLRAAIAGRGGNSISTQC